MGILDKRINPKSEKYIQNQVINNKSLQKYIIDSLNIKYEDSIKFSKGLTYDNRILPDIKISKGDEVLALMECKGANINVTDYVRGIGQLFQYEDFFERNITENKTDTYSKNFKTVYLYPVDVIKNNDFNIANFKYPKTTKILQINLNNFALREFSEEQRKKFSSLGQSLIAISEYYFRDNRLFELYILIQYLKDNFNDQKRQLYRTDLENNHLRKINVINNGNWRNAFISLAGMGFINHKNNLSEKGKEVSKLNCYEFNTMIFFDYIKPYVEELFPLINKNNDIKISDLLLEVKKKHKQKDILFVTESKGRYISSWLNIFRDDFGFIDFEPRRTERKINYNPLNISKEELTNKIIQFSKIDFYLKKTKIYS
tara:strand:+ start:361 stop:1476 length:1116 start_codon:yes stop_codon:yes gene_type:complete